MFGKSETVLYFQYILSKESTRNRYLTSQNCVQCPRAYHLVSTGGTYSPYGKIANLVLIQYQNTWILILVSSGIQGMKFSTGIGVVQYQSLVIGINIKTRASRTTGVKGSNFFCKK